MNVKWNLTGAGAHFSFSLFVHIHSIKKCHVFQMLKGPDTRYISLQMQMQMQMLQYRKDNLDVLLRSGSAEVIA